MCHKEHLDVYTYLIPHASHKAGAYGVPRNLEPDLLSDYPQMDSPKESTDSLHQVIQHFVSWPFSALRVGSIIPVIHKPQAQQNHELAPVALPSEPGCGFRILNRHPEAMSTPSGLEWTNETRWQAWNRTKSVNVEV